MATFEYRALKADGSTDKGALQADSERQARQQLRDQGLTPLSVTPAHDRKTKDKRAWFTPRIKTDDISLFTRQLATLLGAGLPVADALQAVAEQTSKTHVKSMVFTIRSKITEGHSLATSLGHFPKAFPKLYCATVNAGEQTGRLDVILNRLADYTEQQLTLRRKVQQALIYPALMTVISITVVSFLLTYVIPKIITVFTQVGQQLPEITKLLLFASSLLLHYGIFILIVIIASIIAFRYGLRNPLFKQRWHAFLLKVPLIRYLVRTTNTARFARTLGILSNAGVEILTSLTVANQLVNNLVIHDAINTAITKVREGTPLHRALAQTEFFTPMAIHLIQNGEATGHLPKMLEHAANTQENELTRLIDTGLTLFEPLMILTMGMIILFIVLAILLPIFEMDQLIK